MRLGRLTTLLFLAALAACGSQPSRAVDAAVQDAARPDAGPAFDAERGPSAEFAVTGCTAIVAAQASDGGVTGDAGLDGGVGPGGRCLAVAPATLGFVALDEADATTFVWSFGDGSQSSLPSPQHLYQLPGSYSVTLVVGGPGGTDSVMRQNYLMVQPAALGQRCALSQQCASGLRCTCAGDATCPVALQGGLCTRSCAADADCGSGGACVDLTAPGSPPAPYQDRLCVPSCAQDDECRGGLVCRELPRVGAPTGEPGWKKGCFASFPDDVGDSCAGPSGALEPGQCLGGACVGIGARGACTRACARDADCPSYAMCVTLTKSTGQGLCLARCSVDKPCTSDPYLACQLPSALGDLGVTLVTAGATPLPLCSPKRCSDPGQCGSDGACVMAGGASFCSAP